MCPLAVSRSHTHRPRQVTGGAFRNCASNGTDDGAAVYSPSLNRPATLKGVEFSNNTARECVPRQWLSTLTATAACTGTRVQRAWYVCFMQADGATGTVGSFATQLAVVGLAANLGRGRQDCLHAWLRQRCVVLTLTVALSNCATQTGGAQCFWPCRALQDQR